METIHVENGCDIFSWCPDIEEEALEQMKHLARLPYVKHCALMADSHMGMAAPIGSVLACDGVVIPWAVGSDAGCGMGAMRSSLHKSEIESEDIREKLLHSFSRVIPTGFAHNTQKRCNELKNRYGDKVEYIIDKSKVESKFSEYNPIGDIRKEFTAQIGTLGGG